LEPLKVQVVALLATASCKFGAVVGAGAAIGFACTPAVAARSVRRVDKYMIARTNDWMRDG